MAKLRKDFLIGHCGAMKNGRAIRLFHVDAFTVRPFAGNPAAVCLMEAARPTDWMQAVALDMNLSETAFIYPIDGGFHLRWFTPKVEVALCGHATLASAHVLWEAGILDLGAEARFETKSGWLRCWRDKAGIWMDFPSLHIATAAPPAGLLESLGVGSVFVGSSGMDYLVEVADEDVVRSVCPDFKGLATVQARGVIVTAASAETQFDFVSRFFAPAAGVDEDPVTGSAHCALAPYWAAKLGKSELAARQLSQRGGSLRVSWRGERTHLGGNAVTVAQGELLV